MATKQVLDYQKPNYFVEAVAENLSTLDANAGRWPVANPVRSRRTHISVSDKIASFFLMINDFIAVSMAIYCSVLIRDFIFASRFSLSAPLHSHQFHIYFIVIPVLYFGLIFYEGLYFKRLPFWQSMEKIFKICLFATGFEVLFLYFIGIAKDLSRLFMGVSSVFAFIGLSVSRYFTKKVLVKWELWRKPIVIVGSGKNVDMLAKAFEDEPGMGYQIAGLINDSSNKQSAAHSYPVVGDFDSLERAILASGVSEVVIAMPELKRDKLLSLVDRIRPLVRNISIIPDLHELPLSNLEVTTFFNQKAVLLRVRNNLLITHNCLIKRFLDIVFGLIIIIGVSPLMLFLALLVRINSPGPILYKGKRIGKNGREFKCYKFRTMYINEAAILKTYLAGNLVAQMEWERFAKLKGHDPRVTGVGKWLRRFSFDELPQIFNVLKGEMSLVGPRPYLPREKQRMSQYENVILETVPGITGLWQVSGRNDLEFEDRLALDSWYVRNWSFWLDLTLLLKTFRVVIENKGAY